MLFGLGLATLVSGAVVVEIAGYYSLIPSRTFRHLAEEGLEMAGGSIILVSAATFFNGFVKLRAAVPG